MDAGYLVLLLAIVVIPLVLFLINKIKDAGKYDSKGIPHGMHDQYLAAIAPGDDGKPLMYNLTTCRHCVRLHNYLDQQDVDHHDVTVDYFVGDARKEILAKLREYNPRSSFPTLIFPDGKAIIGFKENELIAAIDAYKSDSKQNSINTPIPDNAEKASASDTIE